VKQPNVSQELTGDTARLASQGAGAGNENSKPGSEPRQLSSRPLGCSKCIGTKGTLMADMLIIPGYIGMCCLFTSPLAGISIIIFLRSRSEYKRLSNVILYVGLGAVVLGAIGTLPYRVLFCCVDDKLAFLRESIVEIARNSLYFAYIGFGLSTILSSLISIPVIAIKRFIRRESKKGSIQ